MTTARHISLFISRAACSVLCFGMAVAVQAQNKRPPMPAAKDTVALFRGVAVSADLVGLGQLLLSDYGQYEAALRVNLKDKYFPVIELGYGKARSVNPETTLSYAAKAPYGRVGLDFNVMKNKHDVYRIYAGARYGFASFRYDVSSPDVTDPVWGGESAYRADNINASWHWLEGVFGLDAKLWGAIRVGWSIRYRRRLAYKAGEIGTPWYVPGFGRGRGSGFGATFNVAFEL